MSITVISILVAHGFLGIGIVKVSIKKGLLGFFSQLCASAASLKGLKWEPGIAN